MFYGWIVLPFSIAVNWMNFALYLVGLGPSVTPLEKEFGWSRTYTSGAYSAAGTVGFAAPLFGWFADRFGSRLAILVGAFCSSGGALVLSLDTGSGFMWYAGWMLMMGPTGVWLSYPVTQKIVATWFVKRRGLAMGLQTLAGAFSYIMATVHAVLIDSFGWRANWQIFAAASFAIYMAAFLFIRNTPQGMGWLPDGERRLTEEERAAWQVQQARRPEPTAPAARPAAAPAEYSFRWLDAIKALPFWLIVIAGFAAGYALNIQTTQQVPYLEGMGVSRVIAASVLGTMGLIGAPGRLLVGWLIDRFGRASARYWYAIALGLEAVGMVILIYATSVEMVWVFAVVFGLGQGMTVTAPVVMVANYFGPAAYSTIYSLRLAFLRISTVTAPLLSAWIFDTTGSYQVAFWIATVILVISVAVIYFAVPPKIPIGAGQPARS